MRTLFSLFDWIQSDTITSMFILFGLSILIILPEIFLRKPESVSKGIYIRPKLKGTSDGYEYHEGYGGEVSEIVRKPLFEKYPIVDYLLISLAIIVGLFSLYAAYLTNISVLVIWLIAYSITIGVLIFIRDIGVLVFIKWIILGVIFIIVLAWSISQFGWLNPFIFAAAGLLVHELWSLGIRGSWKTRIAVIAVALGIWIFIVFF